MLLEGIANVIPINWLSQKEIDQGLLHLKAVFAIEMNIHWTMPLEPLT